ncbi:MAG: potassium-transporting ATPase subunit KdpC [Chthoniobacterales bacterium]
MNTILKSITVSIRALLVFTVLCGLIYPFCIHAIAQTFFKNQADGSLILQDGGVIGSHLIVQPFAKVSYFWPRPSAADYATMPSGASNQGFTSKKLKETVLTRAQSFGVSEPQKIPSDLLFASGSGLDPDISLEGAYFQVSRVAKARSLGEAVLRNIVEQCVENPQWNIFGERRVNVLLLNQTLDKIASSTRE